MEAEAQRGRFKEASLRFGLLRGCAIATNMITVEPLPKPLSLDRPRDILLNQFVSTDDARKAKEQYGAAVYAVSKRLLSHAEVRQLPIPADAR